MTAITTEMAKATRTEMSKPVSDEKFILWI